MISHRIAMDIHRERQRQIERRLALRSIERGRTRRRSLRSRLGNALIQIGSALASEGPSVLASSR